jgi:tetratricopeptide (TPR) repeat protein
MVSSLLFVTTLVFQVQGSSGTGFRPTADVRQPSTVVPPEAPKNVTPEMRGDIFMARKMYREALETYKTGPADSAVLANKIGIAYHQMLDLEDARKYYERAVKLHPNYAEAINNLGTVYYARKSYRRSITQYKKALRITPESASILSNLGTSYFARKNYDLAFATYQQALKLDPEVFEHRSTMGILLQERTVDERAKFHYYLARTYAKAGDVEHTLIYVRKALEEGFKEPDKFKKDPEFQIVRDNPEFKLIISAEHKVL